MFAGVFARCRARSCLLRTVSSSIQARLLDLGTVARHDHPLADHGRARRLQLGHLLDFYQAHAASALQRQVGVIAERRHFDPHALARLNEKRARGRGDLLAVDSEIHISHLICPLGC